MYRGGITDTCHDADRGDGRVYVSSIGSDWSGKAPSQDARGGFTGV